MIYEFNPTTCYVKCYTNAMMLGVDRSECRRGMRFHLKYCINLRVDRRNSPRVSELQDPNIRLAGMSQFCCKFYNTEK